MVTVWYLPLPSGPLYLPHFSTIQPTVPNVVSTPVVSRGTSRMAARMAAASRVGSGSIALRSSPKATTIVIRVSPTAILSVSS